MFCWALKQRGVRNCACVELVLPCELRASPRGCHLDSAELLCLFAGMTGKFRAACYCWCVPMLSLHANDVVQRVRMLIGLVCALVLFAALCGHATLEWWGNGAGRCMAVSHPLFTARWCGAHCGADSAV
ncbi:hypothetical protein TcCL_Unassigned05382 [Trypanosoma cruzi]|nr:hypothetical protein TcCL_Unassigned05382 [Trypanosoma cruzi]